jgi:7,8-dihydropterin-6-yl-methyl-4-(beta-D-ribofuranosyl)aminobenzene 5'-phosphate synthase
MVVARHGDHPPPSAWNAAETDVSVGCMSERPIRLEPVDAVDVTIVVDNAIDILVPSTELARRQPIAWDWVEHQQLRAEHGYSVWVTVTRNGRSDTLLYDAGLGRDTAAHNLAALGYDLADVRAVVFSHGHADHHNGLLGISRQLGTRHLPLVLHPDAWRERKIVFPNGSEIRMPGPSQQDLDREGWQVVEERGPSLLLDDTVLVTGQVDRMTDFEKGFPLQHMRTADGGWEPDTWIWDDQAVVIALRGKGLVVLSSCSHAGIINVLEHARRLTGIDHVHACVGGMHLTGGLFEAIIPRTVQELISLAPDVVVPGHCTGYKATSLIAGQLAPAYVHSNVGTTLHFVGVADGEAAGSAAMASTTRAQ